MRAKFDGAKRRWGARSARAQRHFADDPVDLLGHSLFPHVFLRAGGNSRGTREIAG